MTEPSEHGTGRTDDEAMVEDRRSEVTSADEAMVKDPLSEATRKTRLYLLAVSLIGIAMVKTGLVPSKISTLGIELAKPDRNALLFLLSLVTIYFLASFIIYAASDFLEWRAQFIAAHKREQEARRFQEAGKLLGLGAEATRRRYEDGVLFDRNEVTISRIDPRDLNVARMIIEEGLSTASDKDTARMDVKLNRAFGTTGLTRAFLEFVLPILVGLYTIYILFQRTIEDILSQRLW